MIHEFLRSCRTALIDRKGVTAAEYAILAVGIVIVIGAAALAFQGPLQSAFISIGAQIGTSQNSVASR